MQTKKNENVEVMFTYLDPFPVYRPTFLRPSYRHCIRRTIRAWQHMLTGEFSLSPFLFSDFSQMSAQTIFSFLDYLTRWARLKADSTCKTQILNSRSERHNQDTAGAFLFQKL